jgi:hypothetical protein
MATSFFGSTALSKSASCFLRTSVNFLTAIRRLFGEGIPQAEDHQNHAEIRRINAEVQIEAGHPKDGCNQSDGKRIDSTAGTKSQLFAHRNALIQRDKFSFTCR